MVGRYALVLDVWMKFFRWQKLSSAYGACITCPTCLLDIECSFHMRLVPAMEHHSLRYSGLGRRIGYCLSRVHGTRFMDKHEEAGST